MKENVNANKLKSSTVHCLIIYVRNSFNKNIILQKVEVVKNIILSMFQVNLKINQF